MALITLMPEDAEPEQDTKEGVVDPPLSPAVEHGGGGNVEGGAGGGVEMCVGGDVRRAR